MSLLSLISPSCTLLFWALAQASVTAIGFVLAGVLAVLLLLARVFVLLLIRLDRPSSGSAAIWLF